ncbi:MAG: phosphoadenylyl-sulfate reductase [Rhodobacteraceae bacterium]|nr:phosphoadenylyl-sulfate reductase [Paracoccaceae bacterium]MCW9044071.1 phosphoadenylyl-sulfate reductase [Pseudopelagicola sp.]
MTDRPSTTPFDMPSWPTGGLDEELTRLQETFIPSLKDIDLRGLLHDPALDNLCIVSSFGTESAALLHLVTRLRPETPVLFLDTGKHFEETLTYRDTLAKQLDLNVVVLRPEPQMLDESDPSGTLHAHDPNSCCMIRKTLPLQDAIQSYDAWVSGRKRFQGATRSVLPLLERDGEKIKINPLALWGPEDIEAYFVAHALPRHPLQSKGFQSIGCAPCTRAVSAGEDPRAGRWPQMPDKTECGIHLGPDGKFVRQTRSRE